MKMVRLSIGLLCMSCFSQADAQAKYQTETLTVFSAVYTIDRIYKSMEGPWGFVTTEVLKDRPPELLWITGVRTEVVGEDGKNHMADQFMCHMNVDINPDTHRKIFGSDRSMFARLFGLYQGQMNLGFPEGFGMPIMSNEPINLPTQVMNLNYPWANFHVRHKITIEFVRDKSLKKPMKPLFSSFVTLAKLLEGKSGDFDLDTDPTRHGPSCLPGQPAPNATPAEVIPDSYGRKFATHWLLKPGREVNRMNVTKWLNLPYDTTLHCAIAHMHPFAESLELRDLTIGRRIFKCRFKNLRHGIGISHATHYSSMKGIPLFKDHEYQLISTYNNTSTQVSDAMAFMILFLSDKDFKKPIVSALRQNENE